MAVRPARTRQVVLWLPVYMITCIDEVNETALPIQEEFGAEFQVQFLELSQ